MIIQEEVYCYYCEKTFYLNSFRLREAKTVSCLYCEKRINKKKSKDIMLKNKEKKE